MVALDEIRQLPLREKLLMMEAIWDSISQREEELEVPQWHKDILDEREKLVREGKAKFIDWETVKKQIKDSIS
jgi:putative addiction module component (TIGR02574 family)